MKIKSKLKYINLLREIEIQSKNEKQTNLWIPPSQSNIYIQLFVFRHHCILQEEPWHTSMVMSPAEPSLLYAMKRGGPKQGTEGGYNWSALGDGLTGKLSLGCLADTR